MKALDKLQRNTDLLGVSKKESQRRAKEGGPGGQKPSWQSKRYSHLLRMWVKVLVLNPLFSIEKVIDTCFQLNTYFWPVNQ